MFKLVGCCFKIVFWLFIFIWSPAIFMWLFLFILAIKLIF